MRGTKRKMVSDLLGKSFGRLTVTEYIGLGKYDKHYWKCSCECGGEITLPTYRITGKASATSSCGCLRKERLRENRYDPTTHDLSNTKLYAVFQSMKHRCSNPNSQRFDYYGGKGVKVLWETVEDFVAWAESSGYTEGLSIDRVDSDGDYCPENCRWISLEENTRRAHLGRIKSTPRA